MTIRLKRRASAWEALRPNMIRRTHRPRFSAASTLPAAGFALFAALFGAACSSDDSSPEASGGASGAAGTTGSAGKSGVSRDWVGELKITIAGADAEGTTPARSSFFGVVYDKPTPIDGVKFEEAETIGDCKLMLPFNPFCDPSCDINSACTMDGVCTPYSTGQNLGVVSLTGLMPGDFSMDPIAPSYKYQPSPSVKLPYPPCAEGDALSIAAPTVGLTMGGTCVAPLVLLDADTIPVRADQALPLRWEAPTISGTRVGIDLDVAHHGGARGKIVCDVPDTGSFEIPEPLVTRLVGLGLAGFPAITLTRSFRTPSSTEPGVSFVIASTTSRLVDTGVVSCGANLPCPEGMTCKTDRTCE